MPKPTIKPKEKSSSDILYYNQFPQHKPLNEIGELKEISEFLDTVSRRWEAAAGRLLACNLPSFPSLLKDVYLRNTALSPKGYGIKTSLSDLVEGVMINTKGGWVVFVRDVAGTCCMLTAEGTVTPFPPMIQYTFPIIEAYERCGWILVQYLLARAKFA